MVGPATNDALHISQYASRSINFAPALGSLAAQIRPADYGWEGDDEEVEGGRSTTLEDVPMDEFTHIRESGLVFRTRRDSIP